MNAEILMIGTELLLGQIVDTNASYLGQTMAEHGLNLYQKTTVGDNLPRICRCLDEALDRSDVVITSGGLGPTEDDLTREAIAEVLGRPLEMQPELLERLETIFSFIGRSMSENNKKQALLPQGGVAIENPNGTAPGILVDDPRGVIISMPGVPHELKPMMENHALPFIKKKFGIEAVLQSRVLKVCGMGESKVDEAMGDLIRDQSNPTVGVLASPDVVRIRITARAENSEAAAALIAPVEEAIYSRLPGRILGADDDTIESVVDGLLNDRGWTLGVGESASGGFILQRLSWAGCRSFRGGFVAPPDNANATAEALAHDARKQTGSDCGLGVGIDADGAQTCVVFSTPDGDVDWTLRWPVTDKRFQTRVGITALDLVRRHLVG